MPQQNVLRLVKTPVREIQPTATELEITIREYLASIRQAGQSPATLEKYGFHLERLCVWLCERGVTRPTQLTRALLREWGAELYERPSSRTGKPWAPGTIKQAVCAARSFLGWCRDEEIIDENLKYVLKVPNVEKGEQRTLDIIEAITVVNACDTSTPKGIRDKALLSLLLDSGLRASELCRVQVDDLRFEVQLFDPVLGEIVEINLLTVVRKGKKRKKMAYFGAETADRLRDWLKIRAEVVAGEDVGEVFVSLGGIQPGTRLTRDGLRVIVRKLARDAGVTHFSPHALRRSFACLLNQGGASSRNVQLLGGWSSIKEVETYTQNMEVAYQYPRYSPVGLLQKVAEQGLSNN